MTEIPEIRTRKPSGKPPWPLVLLAGVEKAGKSWAAAAFSASDLVDRTFWVEIGEGAADQYGALPGARYEIVEHDGTYMGIGRALRAATLQPRPNGRPHAIVVDSITELWDLLADEQQAIANDRRKKGANGEAPITMDQWNAAKKRWRHIVDMLRQYDGPVILTARLEQVTVMSPSGQPTTAKTNKVRAEKNLGFEVDAVVQIPAPRQYQLTGVRSVRWQQPPDEVVSVPDFTLDGLMRNLGLAEEGATAPRSYTAPKADPEGAAQDIERRAQRSRPKQPEPDEWSTPEPEAAPAQEPIDATTAASPQAFATAAANATTAEQIREIWRAAGPTGANVLTAPVAVGNDQGQLGQYLASRIKALTPRPEQAPAGPPQEAESDQPAPVDPEIAVAISEVIDAGKDASMSEAEVRTEFADTYKRPMTDATVDQLREMRDLLLGQSRTGAAA